ncbi:AN1-type zinc finger protein 2A [Pundamilia nyererei]|uniref:AN1-type zinc finger protein 2A n=1 Tax=Pundamilia nyererei TaxID=303518 RepID=A0A9Y3R3I8_9CICH|nr:PREDICTED: AN1-type zinc finger protein 2A [Pundamilia nyererei]
MEFPDLGEHCSEKTCKRLDFLPMRCDACQEIFCKDHITYANHKCTSSYKKDIQVPVCPLCDTPIPVKRGEMPDIKVGEHIDRDCKSDPAQRKRKIFTNKCSKGGCKQKEMIRVTCDQCRLNYCLKHRHPLDHDCKTDGKPLSKSGCLSPQEQEDLALAQALAASEEEYRRQQQRQQGRDSKQSTCSLS